MPLCLQKRKREEIGGRSMGNALSKECFQLLERYLPQWVALGNELARVPELGYDETRTAQRLVLTLKALGIEPETGWALTGLRATLDGRIPGPRVGLLADMDALRLPDAQDADRLTGASHACGHYIQMVVALAVMAALARSGVMRNLAGSVTFWGTPAEEISDPAARLARKIRREIRYLTGKMELAHRGAFDTLDLALAVHAGSSPGLPVGLSGGSCLLKWVARRPHGPGGSAARYEPADLMLTNTLWPILHEGLHQYQLLSQPIGYDQLQQGGGLLGCLIAHQDPERLVAGNLALNHRLITAAAQLHTRLTVRDEPVYFSCQDDPELTALVKRQRFGIAQASRDGGSIPTGYSDLGVLAARVPLTVIWTGGCVGETHSEGFAVADPQQAYFEPAKTMIATVIELLADEGAAARKIVSNYHPLHDWSQYQSYVSRIQR